MVAMVMQKMGGKILHPIGMVRYMATSGSSYLAVGKTRARLGALLGLKAIW